MSRRTRRRRPWLHHCRAAADNSPVSVLLQRRQELGLSDEQVRTLDSLRNQLQKTSLKQTAAIQIAELELIELQSAPTFDLATMKTKLGEIEGARSQLRFDTLSTTRRAIDVLSPAQRRRRIGPLLVVTPLDADKSLEGAIQQQVQTAIREQLRDQKVVEVETTQAIVDRLTGMGNRSLPIGGIPLAILSFFGVKKLTILPPFFGLPRSSWMRRASR